MSEQDIVDRVTFELTHAPYVGKRYRIKGLSNKEWIGVVKEVIDEKTAMIYEEQKPDMVSKYVIKSNTFTSL